MSCLTIHYHFSEEEASQLVEHLAKFDKIKLDTLKEHLYKRSPSPEKEKKGKSREKFDKNKSSIEKPTAPFKKEQEGKKMIDPRRQKINVPLVR